MKGAVTLNSITADSSAAGPGAFVTNSTDGKGVTRTGTNVFNDNKVEGLDVNSGGPITLNSITANDNLSVDGVEANNFALSSTPQAFKLTGTNVFNGNANDGIQVFSRGAISASGITANDNNVGIYFDNHQGSGGVTLTGTSNAIGNKGFGVYVGTTGAVSLTDLAADGNTSDGLKIDSAGNITLTCGGFTNNLMDGVDIAGTHASSIWTWNGGVSSGNGIDIFPTLSLTNWNVIVRNCP